MDEIKYKTRTNKELEDMRNDLRIGKTLALCLYSDAEICDPYCGKFNDCWRTDYTSQLENKIKK